MRKSPETIDAACSEIIAKALAHKQQKVIKRNYELGSVIAGKKLEVTMFGDNIVNLKGAWVNSPDPDPVPIGTTIVLRAKVDKTVIGSYPQASRPPYDGFCGYFINGFHKSTRHLVSLVDIQGTPQVAMHAAR